MNDIMDAVYDFIKTYAYDPNDANKDGKPV